MRLRQGYTDEAIELAREALEIATEGDQAWPHIVAARTVALTLIAGDPPDCDKAEAAVDTAIKLAEEREMLPELAWSQVVKAKVCAARGDAEGSGAAVQKAASLFEKMGLDRELKRVGSRACG